MSERQIATLRGKFSAADVEGILGQPTNWPWEHLDAPSADCGLQTGPIETAGFGSIGACYRVWIHSDGICIGPGLDVPGDWDVAREAYEVLSNAFKDGA